MLVPVPGTQRLVLTSRTGIFCLRYISTTSACAVLTFCTGAAGGGTAGVEQYHAQDEDQTHRTGRRAQ
eukprot:2297578-Rhodomonas_salina.1